MKLAYIETELVVAVKAQAEANEKRKRDTIVQLYETGRIDGLYFGRTSKSKGNPIKHYIKAGLFKKRVTDFDLIEDCYNEMFCYLQEMPAAKFCKILDESPNKLIATALRIIALKCFAIDPRHGNPKHSLVEGILFASAQGGARIIDRCEIYTDDEQNDEELPRYIVTDTDGEPCDFAKKFGFTVEQVVERLPTHVRADFYEAIGKQPKGRQSKEKIERREQLARHLIKIKDSLSAS